LIIPGAGEGLWGLALMFADILRMKAGAVRLCKKHHLLGSNAPG